MPGVQEWRRKAISRKGRIIESLFLAGFIAIAVGMLSLSAWGKTLYVSAGGSDGASGSIDRPWASLQFAVSRAGAGDEISVRGGTYGEGEIWIRGDHGQGGKEGNRLTIRAYPGETPLFVNGKRPFIIEADHIRVEGLHFTNGKSIGIRGSGRRDIQIVKNHFSGKGYAWDAIGVTGTHILVEGNVCDIQGNVVGTQGHCYYISHGSDIIIRNNVARGPTGYGFHVFDQRRGEDPPGFERCIKDVILEGNTASNSEQRAGIIVAAYDHARVENVTIRNNVVYDNAAAGIFVPGIVKKVSIVHNTVYGNRGGVAVYLKSGREYLEDVSVRNNILDLSGTEKARGPLYHVVNENSNPTVILEGNLYWPGPARLLHASDKSPVTGNPLFRNAAGRDFRLKEGSAAIDRGIKSTDPGSDKDGTGRTQGNAPDLGAYEYAPASAR